MKRLLLILLSLVSLVSGVSTPSRVPPARLVASDETTLRAAFARAATVPNLTITLTADIDETSDVMYLRGRGTVLDLGGHSITYRNHYTGLNHGGDGIGITPELSDPEPYQPGTLNAIYCNASGATQAIEVAMGGHCPVGTFVGQAPIQYPGKLRDTYTMMRRIVTPAEGITIKNGRFVCGDPQAFAMLGLAWARNVTVQNVSFDYSGGADANAGLQVQECEGVMIAGCDLGGRHCAIGDGSWAVMVSKCVKGNVTIEERCRGIVISDASLDTFRSNDVTCDFTIVRTRFVGLHPNYGSMAIAEVGTGTITDCVCDDSVWVGTVSNTGMMMIQNTRGRGFAQYGKGVVKQTENSWQEI